MTLAWCCPLIHAISVCLFVYFLLLMNMYSFISLCVAVPSIMSLWQWFTPVFSQPPVRNASYDNLQSQDNNYQPVYLRASICKRTLNNWPEIVSVLFVVTASLVHVSVCICARMHLCVCVCVLMWVGLTAQWQKRVSAPTDLHQDVCSSVLLQDEGGWNKVEERRKVPPSGRSVDFLFWRADTKTEQQFF